MTKTLKLLRSSGKLLKTLRGHLRERRKSLRSNRCKIKSFWMTTGHSMRAPFAKQRGLEKIRSISKPKWCVLWKDMTVPTMNPPTPNKELLTTLHAAKAQRLRMGISTPRSQDQFREASWWSYKICSPPTAKRCTSRLFTKTSTTKKTRPFKKWCKTLLWLHIENP